MVKVGLLQNNVFSTATGALQQRISTGPSGLVVHPDDGAELVKLARGVLEIEKFIPNRRIVINAQRWASPPHVSTHMEKSFRALAEKSGVTIALKTSIPPFAHEFESAQHIVRQMELGTIYAMEEDDADVQELMAKIPTSLKKRVENERAKCGGSIRLAMLNVLRELLEAPRADQTEQSAVRELEEEEVDVEELMADIPASVKKRIHDERLRSDVSIAMAINFVLHELISIACDDRARISTDERSFMLQIANRASRGALVACCGEDSCPIANYMISRDIFEVLHDFDSMRRLLPKLDDDSISKRSFLNILEEYQELSCIADMPSSDEHIYAKTDHSDDIFTIFEGLIPFANRHIKAYAYLHGYRTYGSLFSLYGTACDLMTLSGSYDLVVAIAKGGLFSGGVADLVGLDVRVIEIHAHKRKNATFKFVDKIAPEDVAGKRILLLDKDVVTGDSIKEAVKRLAPYGPSAIGVYFNHPTSKGMGFSSARAAKELETLGIIIHHPFNTPAAPSLPVFYKIHEQLNTPLGRLRKIARAFDEILDAARDDHPEAVEAIQKHLEEQKELFFALNQLLPGTDGVRNSLVNNLERVLEDYQTASTISLNHALERIVHRALRSPHLPESFAAIMAMARYDEAGRELASARKVNNRHVPHSYTASFRNAQRAMRGKYDVALIVGPEGFAYEPIFKDLGLPTVAINIPEADFGGKRTLKAFDDLAQLKGKSVLVVEDDIQSGATLKKLLEELQPHRPKRLGLYLGSQAHFQMLDNVPSTFKRVYVTEYDPEKDAAAFVRHLNKREALFKRKLSFSPFRIRRSKLRVKEQE